MHPATLDYIFDGELFLQTNLLLESYLRPIDSELLLEVIAAVSLFPSVLTSLSEPVNERFYSHLEQLLFETSSSIEPVTESKFATLYQLSVPSTRLFYPEPFLAAPSFMHSDPWFLHILNYQYWLWFTFCVLIVFFFLTFVSTLRWCQLNTRPRRETRGVSRSKCGDLITACVPVSWAMSIIVHESTDAIDYFDGFGTTEMVMGIRAYQWGWEYFYPKNLNINYQQAPSFSSFMGNSIAYSPATSGDNGKNLFYKFYKYNTTTFALNPLSLILTDHLNNTLASSFSLSSTGSSRLKEGVTFYETRRKDFIKPVASKFERHYQFHPIRENLSYNTFTYLHSPLFSLMGSEVDFNKNTNLNNSTPLTQLRTRLSPLNPSSNEGSHKNFRIDNSSPSTMALLTTVSSDGQFDYNLPGNVKSLEIALSDRSIPLLLKENLLSSNFLGAPSVERFAAIKANTWPLLGSGLSESGTSVDRTFPTTALGFLMQQDEQITPSRIWNTVWEATGSNIPLSRRMTLLTQWENVRRGSVYYPLPLYLRYDFLAKNDFPLWESLRAELNDATSRYSEWEASVNWDYWAFFLRRKSFFKKFLPLGETSEEYLPTRKLIRKLSKFQNLYNSPDLQTLAPQSVLGIVDPRGSKSVPGSLTIWEYLNDGDDSYDDKLFLTSDLNIFGNSILTLPSFPGVVSSSVVLSHFISNYQYQAWDALAADLCDNIFGNVTQTSLLSSDLLSIKKSTIALYKGKNAIFKVFNPFYDERRGNFGVSEFAYAPTRKPYLTTLFNKFYRLPSKADFANYGVNVSKTIISSQANGSLRSSFPIYPFPFLFGERGDSAKHRFMDWYARWYVLDIALAPEATFAASGVKHFHKGYQLSKGDNEAIREFDKYVTRLNRIRKNSTLNWLSVSRYQRLAEQSRIFFTNEYDFYVQFLNVEKSFKAPHSITRFDTRSSTRSWLDRPGRSFIRARGGASEDLNLITSANDSLVKRDELVLSLARLRGVTSPSSLTSPLITTLSRYSSATTTVDVLKTFSQTPMRRGITAMNKIHATGAIALPSEIRLQILASSRDVIHSWAVPSAGVKIDCIPGYSSHRTFIFFLNGVYWGQCMEVCGRFHHWMPIVVYFMRRDFFVLWCSHFALQRKNSWDAHPLTYPYHTVSAPASFGSRGWIREF